MEYKVIINRCYGGFSLSLEAVKWLTDKGLKLENQYPTLNELPRHYPLLVECFNILGDEINGDLSKLEMWSVSGKYRINEYDGFESIETPESIVWIDPMDTQ